MIRNVNLIEHLPLFIQEFREIKEITHAENPEFQLVIDESEKIKNNQFIMTSDLTGIAKFEKLLNIKPSAEDTLETRRFRVLSRWNDVVPYTYKALIQKLLQLCDGLNFTIDKNFSEYKMEITTHLELAGLVDELQYLLGYTIPENIALTSKNNIYCNSEGQQNFTVGVAFCQTFELSDACQFDLNVHGESIIGGGIIGTAEVMISDNFKKTLTISGVGNMASNISVTEITSIN